MVITCGGAVVAPLVAFSLYLLGKNIPVYDVRELLKHGGTCMSFYMTHQPSVKFFSHIHVDI